jgi:thioredoxin 1
MASDKIVTLSDENFEEQVIKSAKPVLVDFWAEWCGPCRMLAPTVDALATEFDGRMVVAKLNIDDHPVTPTRFNIRGIPTLLLFKGGKVVEQIVGLVDKGTLKRVLERHV